MTQRQSGQRSQAQTPSTRIKTMSLFSWFTSKPQAHQSHDAGARAAPVPSPHRDGTAAKHAASRPVDASSDAASRQKTERARLRELLYNVVRESMVRVGVLSSSFKFKVLATDPRGQQFIVMMDLSREFGSEISQLTEIETLICQAAKARHNIAVSAVYWRAADPGSIDGSTPPTEAKYRAMLPQTTASAPAPARELAPAPVPTPAPKSKFEPVLADEVMALKRALSGGGVMTEPASPAPEAKAKKNYTLLTGYENTEITDSEQPEAGESMETAILDEEARYPALSATQYGELR